MRTVRYVLGTTLLLGCISAYAADKLITMTGWVNDSKCAAAGKKPTFSDVKNCLAGGEKLVFVDDAEQKVYQVANPKELLNYSGEHVQVKSTLTKEGALKIKDVMGVSDSPSAQAAAQQQ